MHKGRANELSREVVGAAIEVHRILGPGMLESAYEAALCEELRLRGVPYRAQHPVAVNYKGKALPCGYRLDLLVADLVVVELKAVEQLTRLHEAQVLTYLRHLNLWLGLLLNFNTPVMRSGIKRIVNG